MPTTTERYEAMMEDLNGGMTVNEVALKWGYSKFQVLNMMHQRGTNANALNRERLNRLRRHQDCHPCNLEKRLWLICYGQGCYLKHKCEAWHAWRQTCNTLT